MPKCWFSRGTATQVIVAGLLALGSLSGRALAEPAGSTLPLKPARQVEFTTQEGTWLSPDLSPDGKQIVFELLGDLYRIDAQGGEAKAITQGLPFDSQPVFAPDG